MNAAEGRHGKAAEVTKQISWDLISIVLLLGVTAVKPCHACLAFVSVKMHHEMLARSRSFPDFHLAQKATAPFDLKPAENPCLML